MSDLIVPQSAHPAGDLPRVVEAVADGPLVVDTIILCCGGPSVLCRSGSLGSWPALNLAPFDGADGAGALQFQGIG